MKIHYKIISYWKNLLLLFYIFSTNFYCTHLFKDILLLRTWTDISKKVLVWWMQLFIMGCDGVPLLPISDQLSNVRSDFVKKKLLTLLLDWFVKGLNIVEMLTESKSLNCLMLCAYYLLCYVTPFIRSIQNNMLSAEFMFAHSKTKFWLLVVK